MSHRKKRLLIIGAVILAVIIITAGILYWLHARHFEHTDDAFIDGHVSQVSSQVAGRVVALEVADNQRVNAGQLLLRLDPRDYEVRLAQAKAQLQQSIAQVALQHASAGQAKANVHVSEAEAQQARRDLARYRAINPKAITKQQLDNAVATAQSAQARLEASEKAFEAAQAQETAAKATVVQSRSDVENAKLQLSYTDIVAPIEGRITKRSVEPGNVLSPGQPLLAIVSDDMWVTANFKETQLTLMRTGQGVRIRIDAYPDVKFHGHVDSFQGGSGAAFSSIPAENATGNYVKVVQRVPVKIVFDDANERDKYPLSPGLSVVPRVTVR